jgi:hypothetical protein
MMSDIVVSEDVALRSLWNRANRANSGKIPPEEWHWQVYHLSRYGRGLEEALDFLYNEQAAYSDFRQWLEQSRPADREDIDIGTVLTADELAAWERNGYIVVKGAVPPQHCAAARAAIWEFLDADPEKPESWYRHHNGKSGMMLKFFQHPALNAIRRSARIKRIYEELYARQDIYLLIDKVSFNPPETESYRFAGSPLHWDVSLQLPIPYQLQGFVYLNDVDAEDGAFHCVPGFHREIEGWLAGLPAGADARMEALRELKPVPVPGEAGDLVVWNQALPHCATANKGNVPRLVQYVAYKPVVPAEQQVWK